MALSEEQKKKIEEEETYRASIKGELKKKKGIGCFTVILILFGIGIFSSVIIGVLNPSKQVQDAQKKTQSQVAPVFDVPSLVGKDINGVIGVLGTPKGQDPTQLQIQMGATQWDKTFEKDGKELLVTYNISNNRIVDFFISTDDPSGTTTDTGRLLRLGNLDENDTRYRIEFVKVLKDPSSFTGVKVIPN